MSELRGPGSWCCLFLPAVGFVVYFVFGQNLSKKKLYKLNKRTRETMASLIENQRREFRDHRVVFNDEAAQLITRT